MEEKRRDRRGRILRNGEIQLKDGRYRYKYVDIWGNTQYEYSWRLDKNDPTPAGKKRDLSLREKEKLIAADMFDKVVPKGGKMNVIQLAERYISTRTGVTHNTKAGYKTVINILNKEDFGRKRIDTVKKSDAKIWLVKLQQEDGRSYSSIHSIRGVLHPAFQMAVDDDLIRKNPFAFPVSEVIVNDSVTREAISRKQERAFLAFVKADKHFSRYYEGIYILFKTGMRISEFVGLTVADLNFESNTINIDKQLHRMRDGRKIIVPTKTDAGTRVIPMGEDVKECFQTIIAKRPLFSIEPEIDGVNGFLYFDKDGRPMVAMHWEKYFQHICDKYNSIYKEEMPKVTPHVCRHTYCSNMAKSGMNPKTLQYLMGHSEIGVTLNVYTHLGLEDAVREVRKLEEHADTDRNEYAGGNYDDSPGDGYPYDDDEEA
ncbi:MAG: site-specific integrase [Blautia sp.]|nr:site-specific integrase [Blautia sp.]